MADTTLGTSVAIATASLAPELTVVDGRIIATSIQVAEHFGKRHADVLRAIKNLDCSKDFAERNFALSDFTDSTGRKLPCYRMTRDGFTFLAMGFTGKEAARWKEAYINAFNQMESELLAQASTKNDAVVKLHHALDSAARIGAQVQAEVFGQFMNDADFDMDRWLVWFHHDATADRYKPAIKRIELGAFVCTLRRLADGMSDPAFMHKTEDLAYLAKACLAELERRAVYARQVAVATHQGRTDPSPKQQRMLA